MLPFSLKVILFNALCRICHWDITISLLNCSGRHFHLMPLLAQLIRSWNKQQQQQQISSVRELHQDFWLILFRSDLHFSDVFGAMLNLKNVSERDEDHFTDSSQFFLFSTLLFHRMKEVKGSPNINMICLRGGVCVFLIIILFPCSRSNPNFYCDFFSWGVHSAGKLFTDSCFPSIKWDSHLKAFLPLIK